MSENYKPPNDSVLSTIRMERDSDGAIQYWWEQGATSIVGVSNWAIKTMEGLQPMSFFPSCKFWSIGGEVKIDGIGMFTVEGYDTQRGIWLMRKIATTQDKDEES